MKQEPDDVIKEIYQCTYCGLIIHEEEIYISIGRDKGHKVSVLEGNQIVKIRCGPVVSIGFHRIGPSGEILEKEESK